MAVPTLLTSGQASPGTGSWSTASFTPSDGALLVVGVMVVDNGGGSIGSNLTIADSLSPDLTYVNWLTLAEAGGFQPQGKFYTAIVGTGTSMTITFDCGASNALSSVWAVLEFAAGDYFDILPVWSVGSNNALPNNTAASITLGNPARATDCIVAMFQTDGSSSGTIAVTPGSGWSELAEMGTTGTQTLGEIEYLVGASNTADWVDTQTGTMGVFASGGMAIVIRDAVEADDVIVTIGQGAQVVGTTTATPTYPAGYTAVADDLAVVWLTEKIADTGEFTTPSGWSKDGTLLNEVGAQDLRGTVYYKKLTAAEALPAWTGDTADNLSVQCSVFRGVDTTTAIDAVTVMSQSDAADQFTPTSSTATVTANAKCLSLVATSDDNALTMVTTQSFVGLFSGLSFDNTTGTDISAAGACKQIAAATTVVTAPTWDQTVNGTDQWVAAMVLLRPASTGHTVAVNQTTETDLAQPIAKSKTKAIGQNVESDLAQALSVRKIKVLGQNTETDLAQPITARKIKAIGQASETDLAQPITEPGAQTVAVNQATETDLAQPITSSKTKAIGQPAETDLAQAFTHTKIKAIGQNAETDLAQAITATKARAIGQPAETDLAQPITRIKRLLIGQAVETDLAQPITATGAQTAVVGQAGETDLAQAFTHTKIKAIGQNAETDLAQALAVRKIKAIGQAAELDSAQTFTHRKIKAVGQNAETDLAQPIAHTKVRVLGQASETDLAQAFTRIKRLLLAQPFETDSAQAVAAITGAATIGGHGVGSVVWRDGGSGSVAEKATGAAALTAAVGSGGAGPRDGVLASTGARGSGTGSVNQP